MNAVILDAEQMTQLVSLRLMLEDAARQARAVRRFRRAGAVVALDATVERACWLVAVSRGIKVSHSTKLEDLISQLREKLDATWRPTVLPAVKLLHLARNAAQHEGLEPDRDNIPQWASATESFVTSLIEAQFGIDVRTVVLADAVMHPGWSALLREAESRLADDDLASCVRLSHEAHSAALTEWGRLHANPYGPSSNPFDPLRKGLEPVNRRVEALERSLQAQAFASGAADAAWFQDVAAAQPELVTREEAERALRYAFDWITGFELVTSDWVADRAERAAIAARLERDGDTSARIHSVLSIEPERGWATMTVRCADVPSPDAYPAWRDALQALLATERTYPQEWEVRADGTVVRRFSVAEPHADVEGDLAKLNEALVEADRQLSEAAGDRIKAKHHQDQTRRQKLEELHRRGTPLPDWIRAIEWQPTRFAGQDEATWFIQVSDEASKITFPDKEQQDGRVARIADLFRRHPLIGSAFVGSAYGIGLAPAVTTEALRQVIDDVDVEVSVQLNQQRERDRATAAACMDMLDRAQRALRRYHAHPADTEQS